MERYGNLAGDSGVVAYAITARSILVKFAGSDRLYEYSHASAGKAHVETMKRLAQAGRGLSTYISRHVADDYVR
ncbi:hypothetical protein DT603_11585 [Pseudoxanthomonas gei]|uniref:KTSC domain-containing protein n=1 Tax=Pseudoxanthomonas gei TaxID=1383030 RepID=A0ABX0AD24_9GAMM|nr:hypothetical protein [Pseudoxanthomonas gei]NDK39484.1 hypothetical protein [Pseudoxanthomonas gei]